MEEERQKKKSKAEEKDIVTSSRPLLPRKPYPWLMIKDVEEDSDRHIFYSITEDRYYVKFVPELRNKFVLYCYGGLLVLKDMYIDDWSVLNIQTMEKLQLPSLPISPQYLHTTSTYCVMSSSEMDRSCRVIFVESSLGVIWSCHLGDSEFIEQESTYTNGIRELINFKGKLYALTYIELDLIVSDISDPDLHLEHVVHGESLRDSTVFAHEMDAYLVESSGDILLICMGIFESEVSYVKIFKADLSIGEWVKLETLGDRAIFLNSRMNSFSSPAKAAGLKGNVVYWVRHPFSSYLPERHLYMYEVEDESISMSLPCPIVGTSSALCWVSFPTTDNKGKKPEQKTISSVFEASEIETNFPVCRDTEESTELQIEQIKFQKREEMETIDSTVVLKKSLWADLPNDLLQEIFQYFLAGDRVVFRSVCKSWYSVSLSPSKSSQQSVLPQKSSDCSSPFLMCPDRKMYHPTNEKFFSMEFSHRPVGGGRIRATRNGWLLMNYDRSTLCFYNHITKAEIRLPVLDVFFVNSVYFSTRPISGDCLVVVAAETWGLTPAICFMKCGEDSWTCREITQERESFEFSSCNAVVYEGLYYFLGYGAKLLIFNPKNDKARVIEAPEFISELKVNSGQQYMLESDGKLIAVFVGTDGSTVYTCKWNVSSSKWEVLESLGNMMLFVSRPLSICKRATLSGTGNNIYFPRVVGDGQILFYSLATRRYHTFELGSSYRNFFGSKFYPEYNSWFMP